MDSLIATFHIDWKIVIAQAVNFAVVIFVLYRYALKPLKKLMDERGETIKGGLDNAKKQEELLAASQEEYDAIISQAHMNAAQIKKDLDTDLSGKRAMFVEKTKAETARLFEEGKKQLEAEKAQMLEEAKKELVALVTGATEKVLAGSMTEKVEAKLVEESIKKVL